MSIYLLSVLTNMTLISFLALSAYLVLIVGQVSFGQQAFFGIGAYSLAISNIIFGFGFLPCLLISMFIGGCSALFLALTTVRISGLYFSISTLAFAELVRLSLLHFRFSREIEGKFVGPDGPEGFRNIRWIFDNNLQVGDFLILTSSILLILIIVLFLFEKTYFFKGARLIGKNRILGEALGFRPNLYRIVFITLSGIVASLGGALFALFNTYIEPAMFGLMLGVHGLAYSIIGGLGTPIGPLLGVIIDIGILESIRFFSSYRMIIFGGLVATILIVFPEGLISPNFLARIKSRRSKSNA